MPLFTLIALLLAMFGATLSLLSALRSHHGKDIEDISLRLSEECAKVKGSHEATSKTTQKSDKAASQICRWHEVWKWVMIVPVWVFSGIIFVLAVWILLFCDWADPQSASGVEVFVSRHPWACKAMVAVPLLVNATCYVAAQISQMKVHTAWRRITDISDSVVDRSGAIGKFSAESATLSA